VNGTLGSLLFPLSSVHCLETDIIPCRVHRFDVSPDGIFPGNGCEFTLLIIVFGNCCLWRLERRMRWACISGLYPGDWVKFPLKSGLCPVLLVMPFNVYYLLRFVRILIFPVLLCWNSLIYSSLNSAVIFSYSLKIVALRSRTVVECNMHCVIWFTFCIQQMCGAHVKEASWNYIFNWVRIMIKLQCAREKSKPLYTFL